MTNQNIKKTATVALLAAMTCVATMIIKIPTPTFGYIHPGDGFVLLCGVVLGPLPGALAAGIGSMFSDIFSGYVTWAPATFIIKALTGGIAGLLFHQRKHPALEKGTLRSARNRRHRRRSHHGHRLFSLRNRTCRTRQRSLKPGIYRRRHCFLCDRYPV